MQNPAVLTVCGPGLLAIAQSNPGPSGPVSEKAGLESPWSVLALKARSQGPQPGVPWLPAPVVWANWGVVISRRQRPVALAWAQVTPVERGHAVLLIVN